MNENFCISVNSAAAIGRDSCRVALPARHGGAEAKPLPSSASLRLCVENIFAAAAHDSDGSVAVMVANPGDGPVPFTLEVAPARPVGTTLQAAPWRVRITDADRTYEEIPLPSELPPHSFLVAVFRP